MLSFPTIHLKILLVYYGGQFKCSEVTEEWQACLAPHFSRIDTQFFTVSSYLFALTPRPSVGIRKMVFMSSLLFGKALCFVSGTCFAAWYFCRNEKYVTLFLHPAREVNGNMKEKLSKYFPLIYLCLRQCQSCAFNFLFY